MNANPKKVCIYTPFRNSHKSCTVKDFSLLYSELKMNISSPQDVKPLYDKDLLVQLLEVAKASGTKEALQSEDNQRRVLFILGKQIFVSFSLTQTIRNIKFLVEDSVFQGL